MGTYKVRILTPEQADAKYATKGELAAVVGGEDGSGVGINPAANQSASAAGAVYIYNGL